MKFVFLHRKLSPYWVSCLLKLKKSGCQNLVISYSFQNIAPFEIESVEKIGEIIDRSVIDKSSMLKKIKEFNPDALIVSGWKDNLYIKICRYFKKKKIPIILTFDTQPNGGFNNRLFRGKFISKIIIFYLKIYLRNLADKVWVPGNKQIEFAKKLGFKKKDCWAGLYASDLNKYRKINILRNELGYENKDHSFLFVGRYVKDKGLDVLYDAYKYYKSNNKKPWKLICAGGGDFPFKNNILGIENKGFIQPKDINNLFLKASALVLPSTFEPWGVIVHEATAAGLPIIVSDACGSSEHLVKNGINGYIFPSGDFISLAYKMRVLSNLDKNELQSMGNNSLKISKQYSSNVWVKTLLEGVRNN